MHLLALSISRHNGFRLEELAGLLMAIAGVALLFPLGMLGGRRVAGLALAAASVLFIVAVRWAGA